MRSLGMLQFNRAAGAQTRLRRNSSRSKLWSWSFVAYHGEMLAVGASENVLVVGGAGYIGSHTAKLLTREGLVPVVLDNFSTGHRENVRYGPFVDAGASDGAAVRSAVERYRPSGVILFAGYIAVGESTANPRKYFDNNVAAILALLNTLMDSGIRRVVFSSSAAVYGIQERMPLLETSPPDPVSPYADTKWFIERILSRYGTAYGLRSMSLRYFNAAGADPEGELGERHQPETHLIPLAMRAAMGGPPLRVFGTDYPTPDGTAIRDYVHVTDLAAAHLLALRHLVAGGESAVLNLGTGEGHSVREVIGTIERIGQCRVPREYGPRREGDAPVLVADPERAKALLGWHTAHSSLETIVKTAWAWHRREEPVSAAH
jgi:UDP-arabinose 4-epimerase